MQIRALTHISPLAAQPAQKAAEQPVPMGARGSQAGGAAGSTRWEAVPLAETLGAGWQASKVGAGAGETFSGAAPAIPVNSTSATTANRAGRRLRCMGFSWAGG